MPHHAHMHTHRDIHINAQNADLLETVAVKDMKVEIALSARCAYVMTINSLVSESERLISSIFE